jgi:hypothetical protein
MEDQRAVANGDPTIQLSGGSMFRQPGKQCGQQMRGKAVWRDATSDERSVKSVINVPAKRAQRTGTELRHTMPARGLAAMFGLDIRAATLAIIVDLMVFSGDAISMGLLIPLGIGVACVLSFIVYKIQVGWGRDSHDSALIKALTIGLLTAIPFPLTPLVALPAGVLGIVSAFRRK